jgi:hypothetical protein
VLLYCVIRREGSGRDDAAERTLAERYVRGEIDDEVESSVRSVPASDA